MLGTLVLTLSGYSKVFHWYYQVIAFIAFLYAWFIFFKGDEKSS
ncbi:conserved hypothetical protein [Oenococcus oeni]|nr:conserved hypothetical protein [Oenococcus oeni]SYW10355.1 conserved hypothetical protein [Oenococcus oeni]